MHKTKLAAKSFCGMNFCFLCRSNKKFAGHAVGSGRKALSGIQMQLTLTQRLQKALLRTAFLHNVSNFSVSKKNKSRELAPKNPLVLDV